MTATIAMPATPTRFPHVARHAEKSNPISRSRRRGRTRGKFPDVLLRCRSSAIARGHPRTKKNPERTFLRDGTGKSEWRLDSESSHGKTHRHKQPIGRCDLDMSDCNVICRRTNSAKTEFTRNSVKRRHSAFQPTICKFKATSGSGNWRAMSSSVFFSEKSTEPAARHVIFHIANDAPRRISIRRDQS